MFCFPPIEQTNKQTSLTDVIVKTNPNFLRRGFTFQLYLCFFVVVVSDVVDAKQRGHVKGQSIESKSSTISLPAKKLSTRYFIISSIVFNGISMQSTTSEALHQW